MLHSSPPPFLTKTKQNKKSLKDRLHHLTAIEYFKAPNHVEYVENFLHVDLR